MSLDITLYAVRRTAVHDANITHNLGEMARAAGFYGAVWRPEENGITTAAQLIKPLREGIWKMEANPDHYRQFDAENKWGTYDDFLPWLRELLAACEKNPDAEVSVSR